MVAADVAIVEFIESKRLVVYGHGSNTIISYVYLSNV